MHTRSPGGKRWSGQARASAYLTCKGSLDCGVAVGLHFVRVDEADCSLHFLMRRIHWRNTAGGAVRAQPWRLGPEPRRRVLFQAPPSAAFLGAQA